MLHDSTSIIEIKGVGEKIASLFRKLGLETVGDLIRFFPRDYVQYDSPRSISTIVAGEKAAVLGTVLKISGVKKIRNLTLLNVLIRDDTGSMQLTFFNQQYLQKLLKPGTVHVFYGKIRANGAALTMESPKRFSPDEYLELTRELQPAYPLTKGLTNSTVRRCLRNALNDCVFFEDYLTPEQRERLDLVDTRTAFFEIHFPNTKEAVLAAHKRLSYDEFFFFLLMMRKSKDLTEGLPNRHPMFETADTVRYVDQLPFRLTRGQKQTWQEIRDDLEGPLCMNRLVQGDVGSGKTIVAFLALLMTVANGYQGALMAPTEVLAAQHFDSVSEDIRKYDLAFRPVLLVGSMTAKEKKAAYERIACGDANLIIGTHALIQEKVQYKNLALVVTDEQHRFGVRQRETLAEKGLDPHVLVMSATPIPRTLAIILYGDLKLSVIRELPSNRLPIKNCVVGVAFRPKAYDFIAGQVREGHQAYVICPQVDEGEMEDLENVVDYAEKLRGILPPSVVVGHLHGKMRPADKTRIMNDFAAGHIDVLVSTTVIEVGINVPNATVMMVENAERFGLAQLHQLRGRVGRGDAQSFCIFLSTSDKKETMDRLDILNHSNDGFFIASEDLKLRGPGDLFGIRQSGEFHFRVGDIYNDSATLQLASDEVDRLLLEDPTLQKEEHATLLLHYDAALRNSVDFRSI